MVALRWIWEILSTNSGKGDWNMNKKINRGRRPSVWCDLDLKNARRVLCVFRGCVYCEWIIILISALWSSKNAAGGEDILRDCRKNRGVYCNHQPCEPFFKLWKRWLWHGICQTESGTGRIRTGGSVRIYDRRRSITGYFLRLFCLHAIQKRGCGAYDFFFLLWSTG